MSKASKASTKTKTTVAATAPVANKAPNKIIQNAVTALLVLTILFIYIPFNPLMPGTALDQSWTFGLNQAASQHLVIGKDIVFTFGPYASVYTKSYHPDTNYLALLGGLVLAAFTIYVALRIIKSKPLAWQFFLAYIFAAIICANDVQLFIYPILVALYIYTLVADKNNTPPTDIKKTLVTISLFVPFGLLLLIKGSLLLLVAGLSILCAALFWYKGWKKEAIGAIAAPLVAVVVFQLIAGQPISGLFPYFKNMLPVISGYNEAMSIAGNKSEPILFVLVSLAILVVCYRTNSKTIAVQLRLFLVLSLAPFLFTIYKAGFTRHDAHALTGTGSLLAMAYLLLLVLPKKTYYFLFGAAALVWLIVGKAYTEQGAFDNLKVPVYGESIQGLALRLGGGIKEKYEEAITEIKNQPFKIPALKGTADLYSYEQGYLLASGNTWSPRPVIQSYSAYTPELAKMNEAHLTSDKAPNNIIFKVQPIDRRLPALDDGLSWPTIINNYQLDHADNGFLFLKQKRAQNLEPVKTAVATLTCTIGDDIAVPNSAEPLFAEFDINASFVGGLAAALYKPDLMQIIVTLVNGRQLQYRFVPKMGKAGFVLSPVVTNTETFAQLLSSPDQLKANYVKSFKIVAPGTEDKSLFDTWKPEYTVRLYKIAYN